MALPLGTSCNVYIDSMRSKVDQYTYACKLATDWMLIAGCLLYCLGLGHMHVAGSSGRGLQGARGCFIWWHLQLYMYIHKATAVWIALVLCIRSTLCTYTDNCYLNVHYQRALDLMAKQHLMQK